MWVIFVTLNGEVIFQVATISHRIISCDEVLTLDDGEDVVTNPRKYQINSYEHHIQKLILPITLSPQGCKEQPHASKDDKTYWSIYDDKQLIFL